MNIFKVLLSIIDSRVQVYREIKTSFSLKKHGDSASKKTQFKGFGNTLAIQRCLSHCVNNIRRVKFIPFLFHKKRHNYIKRSPPFHQEEF